MASPGVFLEDVWSRNFLNLFASPLTIPQYLLGLVITSTVDEPDRASW